MKNLFRKFNVFYTFVLITFFVLALFKLFYSISKVNIILELAIKVASWVVFRVVLALPFICALLAVAFYTLIERKLLGIFMIRKGPNKVGFIGVMQPFRDAGKLFTKEVVVPRYSNKGPFLFCPAILLGFSLILWVLYPFKCVRVIFVCGLIQFLLISGLRVYGVIVAGWSSNSKYALLGSVRAVAQRISYEVPLRFVQFSITIFAGSILIQEVSEFQINGNVLILCIVVRFVVWVICILAETNRAPFDLVEGESELVSGFNVEYSGGAFALVYIAEYSRMLFNRLITGVLFFGVNELFISIIALVFACFYVLIRAATPRIRYDKLIYVCWTVVLCFILILSLIVILNCFNNY